MLALLSAGNSPARSSPSAVAAAPAGPASSSLRRAVEAPVKTGSKSARTTPNGKSRSSGSPEQLRTATPGSRGRSMAARSNSVLPIPAGPWTIASRPAPLLAVPISSLSAASSWSRSSTSAARVARIGRVWTAGLVSARRARPQCASTRSHTNGSISGGTTRNGSGSCNDHAVIDVTHFTDPGCPWAYSALPAHATRDGATASACAGRL